MPSFCLISGHLSPKAIDERRARSLFQLFATYLIFQSLNYLNLMLSFRLNGFNFETWPVQIFQTDRQVVTWFLLALLIWRLSMPVLNRTHVPILISLFIGLASLGADLGVNYQNLASFFPYFAIGNWLPRKLWRCHLSRPALRLPFGVSFLVAAAVLLTYSALGAMRFKRSFGGLAFTYACFNGAPPAQRASDCASNRELFHRAAFYVCSAPLILGFLCLLPTRRGLWSVPGYMSMYVYLLHQLILCAPPARFVRSRAAFSHARDRLPRRLVNPLVMRYTFAVLSYLYGHEINVWSPASDVGAVAMLVPVALLACAALSTPAARWLLWALVEPPTGLLFK